jgi:hypothetical protein
VVVMRIPSNLPPSFHQPAENADQIAAHGAADASVVHFEDFLVGTIRPLSIPISKPIDDDRVMFVVTP